MFRNCLLDARWKQCQWTNKLSLFLCLDYRCLAFKRAKQANQTNRNVVCCAAKLAAWHRSVVLHSSSRSTSGVSQRIAGGRMDQHVARCTEWYGRNMVAHLSFYFHFFFSFLFFLFDLFLLFSLFNFFFFSFYFLLFFLFLATQLNSQWITFSFK